MASYRFLPDVAIADVAIEAEGDTLEEVFVQCALAVTEIQVTPGSLGESVVKEILIEHAEPDRLLFEFLEELVYLKDAELFLAKRFDVKIETNNTYHLKAKAYGDTIDPAKHQLDKDVKAITMHMFNLNKTEKGYKATVVVDI